MATNKVVPLVLVGLAALMALIAIFTPWWTLKVDAFDVSESAGPFNSNEQGGNQMISDGAALTTGLTTIFGILLLAAAAAMLVTGLMGTKTNPMMTTVTPWLALAGGVVLALGLVLAIFMYPSEANKAAGEDVSFWDSSDGTDLGAGFGWYLGLVGAVLGIVGGVMTMMGTTARRGMPTT